MIDVLFFVDFESGHLYPTLKLANSLKEEGFIVGYAGPIDLISRKLVENHGFIYYQIFEDVYPNGYHGETELIEHYDALLSGSLDNLMESLSPKLVLFSSFLCLEGLIFFYKYKVKLITYCTFYLLPVELEHGSIEEEQLNLSLHRFMKLSGNEPQRLLKLARKKNKSLSNFNDIIAPLKTIPRLMLCPTALKVNHVEENENEIYLGPGIIESRYLGDFLIDDFLPKNKKMIFVSMGSQVKRYPEKAKQAFKMTTRLMEMPQFVDFHMFLSVGGTNVKDWDLGDLTNNISVFVWVPQKEVLKKASIAITHGGLGTIKECIFYGVPMLVIPMGRDQTDNAERVVYHKLGLKADIECINSDVLSKEILRLIKDPEIHLCLSDMKKLFREENESKIGVNFIKEFIKPS